MFHGLNPRQDMILTIKKAPGGFVDGSQNVNG